MALGQTPNRIQIIFLRGRNFFPVFAIVAVISPIVIATTKSRQRVEGRIGMPVRFIMQYALRLNLGEIPLSRNGL